MWAARHNRREVYFGMSTLQAIVGDKMAPGLLDHYLSRTGLVTKRNRRMSRTTRTGRIIFGNRFPGDHGAHGRFDHRASDYSLQLWATIHRKWLAFAGAAAALVMWCWRRSR